MAESCAKIEEDDKKLSEIFDDALDIYERILKSDEPSSSSKVQTEIKNSISLLEKCTHLINAAGVFSSNESADEIPTHNLKFLLIPALLGSLVVKVQTPDRFSDLETAEIYFKDFLKRVKDYEIVNSICFEDLEEKEEEKPKKLDLHQLAIQRNEKIRKYKEQKQTEAELKRLKSLMIQDDDEICRNYYMTYIRNLVNVSLDELASIKQEKPLAKHLAESRAKGTYNQEKAKENNVQKKPFKPIIITRNEVQKKVFGAGYPSLPTMTVEEFYKQRVAEGIFPAEGSSYGLNVARMLDPEVVQSGEEAEEIQKENEIENDDPGYLEKTRSMDEYKDTHKRGWGNTFNRS